MDEVRLEVRKPSKEFVEQLTRDPPFRIPGTAIVLGRMAKGVPLALSRHTTPSATAFCTRMFCLSP